MERALAERAAELSQARAEQVAVAEILRVVSASFTDTQPVFDAIEVSVTDTGGGIAPEDCEAVFEEFRQVGTHAEGKAQGTGLGLALTKKFIELHGGRIWLTSAVGKGSTFSFTLPLAHRGLTPRTGV